MTTMPESRRIGSPKHSRRAAAFDLLERGGLLILLVGLIVFFAVDSVSGPAFRSSANIQNILGNQGVTGLIALAMVVPLVARCPCIACASRRARARG